MKKKSALITTALAVSAAITMSSAAIAATEGKALTTAVSTPTVGKIIPLNLLSDSNTKGFNASKMLFASDDCNTYNCSCLCGVRG
jgi:hypothetical protein